MNPYFYRSLPHFDALDFSSAASPQIAVDCLLLNNSEGNSRVELVATVGEEVADMHGRDAVGAHLKKLRAKHYTYANESRLEQFQCGTSSCAAER